MALTEKEKAYRKLPHVKVRNKAYDATYYATAIKKNPNYCKEKARKYRNQHPNKARLNHIRGRARANNILFDITEQDLTWPTHCPVLGIELNYESAGKGGGRRPDNTVSIDRIDPTKGYVKGNVMVISYRSNELKNDASFKEIEAIYNFYKTLQTKNGFEIE